MSVQSVALWPADTILDFVLLLFGSPLLPQRFRTEVVGLIALWLYLYLAKGVVALFKRAFGFRPEGHK